MTSMDRRAHPILSQIPLIVSPSYRAPQAVTLPFNFKRLPQQAPDSAVTGELFDTLDKDAEKFINTTQERDEKRIHAYKEWIAQVRDAEMEEKRRIAPGYLDSTSHILSPTRTGTFDAPEPVQPDSELDKVFGKVSLN